MTKKTVCTIALAVVMFIISLLFTTSAKSMSASELYRWPKGETVWVENHTHMGMRKTVHEWQRGTVVDVRLGHCRKTGGCIRVWSGNYGATGWSGITEYPDGLWDNVILNRVRITFNRYYHDGWAGWQNTKRHELGHALGFGGHRYSRWAYWHSPMYYHVKNVGWHVCTRDRHVLNSAYNK